jgi:outer membrane protein TolC
VGGDRARRVQEVGVAIPKGTCRAARWLAGAGVLVFPACSTLAPAEPAAGLQPPPRLVSRPYPAPAKQGVVPASGEVKEDEKTAPPPRTAFALPAAPAVGAREKPLPINLPTALTLTNARPIDVMLATAQIRVATAQLEQAKVLWLPSVTVGFDYNRHDGKIQNADGTIVEASRGSLMFGAGSGIGNTAILNVNDAIFAPLVARQTLRARQADLQAAQNDSLVAVTDAYFTVQQARGELAGALEVTRRTEDLVQRTRKLAAGAAGLVPELEATRAEAELARRQQVEELARERWRVSSAELVRILRLDPSTQVDPAEAPNLRVDLIDPSRSVDELIPIALTSRPELASRQAQVRATLTLLRQEKLRPLVPSVLLRGWSTPVTGTLAAGVFAGGTNGTIGNTGLRGDIDLQLLWQFDNLGFGNRAQIHRREAENGVALVELFRLQDRVAAEVAQTYARSQEAARRLDIAAQGVRLAVESADKNLAALGQLRRVGDVNQLVVRPLEALAAVQALAQAYTDYYTAVGDYNRAQFQLYRALGHPAQCLVQTTEPPALLPATTVPAPIAPAPTLPPPAPTIPEVPSAPVILPSVGAAPAPAPAADPEPVWQAAPRSPVPVSVHPAVPDVPAGRSGNRP